MGLIILPGVVQTGQDYKTGSENWLIFLAMRLNKIEVNVSYEINKTGKLLPRDYNDK